MGSHIGCKPHVTYCRCEHLRTRSCSDSRLKWAIRFLRPTSEVERQVAQTRVWDVAQNFSDLCLMQSFSDSHLKWDVGFLRLASELERQVSLTCAWNGTMGCSNPCETRSSSDSRWMGTELLRLALNASLLWPSSEVSVLLWTRGLRFNLKRDLRVEVRFASDDLSLVIFEQPLSIS